MTVLVTLFQKVVDEETRKEAVVGVRLPQIDAHDAVNRSGHIYAWTADGFKKTAPAAPAAPAFAGLVGPTGGKPAIEGGIGVLGVVDKEGKVNGKAIGSAA